MEVWCKASLSLIKLLLKLVNEGDRQQKVMLSKSLYMEFTQGANSKYKDFSKSLKDTREENCELINRYTKRRRMKLDHRFVQIRLYVSSKKVLDIAQLNQLVNYTWIC